MALVRLRFKISLVLENRLKFNNKILVWNERKKTYFSLESSLIIYENLIDNYISEINGYLSCLFDNELITYSTYKRYQGIYGKLFLNSKDDIISFKGGKNEDF